MGEALALPTWVSRPDGRLEPFEPDRICRSLFAALADLGRPDAFLARELTDGVLHFLSGEFDAAPTSTELTEFVAKIVRELGHPAVALRYTDRAADEDRTAPPEDVKPDRIAGWVAAGLPAAKLTGRAAGQALREYSLRDAFPPELVSAHRDDLLSLTGLETPLELAGVAVGPVGRGLFELIAERRECAGQFLAFDEPEYALAPLAGPLDELADQFARELTAALPAAGLAAVVNLNSAITPPWASDPDGPLFATLHRTPNGERRRDLTDALFLRLTAPESAGSIRIDWHLGAADFAPEALPRLARVARRALTGSAVTFCFDRPRQPLRLAEGLDRRCPGVLAVVGVNLPRLARNLADPEQFLRKLTSLARLAKSVGHVRQDYLRKYGRPAAARGFLVERARLVVVPVGLEAVARQFTGRGLCPAGSGIDFARQMVERLREALASDRTRALEAVLDSPPPRPAWQADEDEPDAITAPGLTAWDPDAPPKQQLRAAAALHDSAGGTAELLLLTDEIPSAEEAVRLLQFAWGQTGVVRCRFRRPPARPALADLWG